ncbi:MAG TPA: hypothetical protein DCM08_10785 [Microscillaceae bacterium]|nr:hypothetical protein [Microscillaceae bacterium]
MVWRAYFEMKNDPMRKTQGFSKAFFILPMCLPRAVFLPKYIKKGSRLRENLFYEYVSMNGMQQPKPWHSENG